MYRRVQTCAGMDEGSRGRVHRNVWLDDGVASRANEHLLHLCFGPPFALPAIAPPPLNHLAQVIEVPPQNKKPRRAAPAPTAGAEELAPSLTENPGGKLITKPVSRGLVRQLQQYLQVTPSLAAPVEPVVAGKAAPTAPHVLEIAMHTRSLHSSKSIVHTNSCLAWPLVQAQILSRLLSASLTTMPSACYRIVTVTYFGSC